MKANRNIRTATTSRTRGTTQFTHVELTLGRRMVMVDLYCDQPADVIFASSSSNGNTVQDAQDMARLLNAALEVIATHEDQVVTFGSPAKVGR